MAKTQAIWRERVARWRESGKSIEEFAEREGVKLASLKWWRWRLEGAREKTAASAPPARNATFVEVEAGAAVTKPAPVVERSCFEVVLGNGRIVRVPAGFVDSELARVLAVAEGTRR